jgi:pyruvate/2-oxoacid:ferredoxin oxidoreductase alpha subunit
MVCYDGYVLSHTLMPVSVPDIRLVREFLPPYRPHTVLDPDTPMNINPVTLADPRKNADGVLCHGYYELRQLLQEALLSAVSVIEDVGANYGKVFGRSYGILDTYRCDDAELLLVSMGSLASEAMDAVDMLRNAGQRVGVLNVRLYRPFPAARVAAAIRDTGCRGIAVMEKDVSYGYEGALCSDLKAALFDHRVDAFAHSYILGLGGRDVGTADIIEGLKKSYAYLDKPRNEQNKDQEWLNSRL